MFGTPIKDEGPDGGELGQGGVQDAEVEVMSAVDPDESEEGEVGDCDAGFDVRADFGGLDKSSGVVFEMVWGLRERLTARKKSLISWVM